MAVRNIVKIDEARCTGCGQCVGACAEGAIKIVNGKAKLVSDSYCDGLGACLGHCPEDAITIEQREAPAFDEEAVKKHLAQKPVAGPPFVCPGLAVQQFEPQGDIDAEQTAGVPSQLTQWPVQLKLVSPTAQCFRNAHLLLTADCVPLAMGDFHRRFLKGRSVLLGCPKLDDVSLYVGKLADILRANEVQSLTVVHMDVPCCSGLTRIAREAILRSGKGTSFEDVTISIRGDVIHNATVALPAASEATPDHA